MALDRYLLIVYWCVHSTYKVQSQTYQNRAVSLALFTNPIWSVWWLSLLGKYFTYGVLSLRYLVHTSPPGRGGALGSLILTRSYEVR